MGQRKVEEKMKGQRKEMEKERKVKEQRKEGI